MFSHQEKDMYVAAQDVGHVAASFVQDRSMVRPSLASVLDVQVLA